MNKRAMVLALIALVALVTSTPALAQDGESGLGDVDWGILGAAFAIAVAAAFGAGGQGRAVAAAVSALARNPG